MMQEDREGSDWQRKYFLALLSALFPTLMAAGLNICQYFQPYSPNKPCWP